MQAWFVVVIFGQIVATIGPTSMETCKAVVADATQRFDSRYERELAADMPPVGGRTVYRNDVYAACFMQPDRPKIGEKVETN